MNKKHHTKLYIIISLFLGFVLFFSAYLSICFYHEAEKQIEQIILSNLKIVASETASKLSYKLSGLTASTKWLSDNIINIKSNNDKYKALAYFYQKNYSVSRELVNIWILDKNGILEYMTPDSLVEGKDSCIGKNYSFRGYFKKAAVEKRPVISSVLDVINNVKNRYKTIIIAIPLFKDNEFNGILGADINLKQFIGEVSSNINEQLNTDTKLDLFCLSTKDKIIVNRYYDLKGNKLRHNLKESDIVNSMPNLNMLATKDKSFSVTLMMKSGEYLVGGARVIVENVDTSYIIMAAMPYDHVNKYLYSLYIKLVLLMLFVLVSILVVLVLIVKKEKTIIKLKKEIQNLEIRIDSEAKQKQINNIIESDYFNNIIKKAESLKKQ